MTKKTRIVLIGIATLVALLGAVTVKFFSTSHVRNASVSGWRFGNQEWSETITITGDTIIIGNLTVQPGTKVQFAVSDDRHSGDEIGPDGYNDNDPTRLKSWTTTHSNLVVLRKIIAQGTAQQRILFTSAAAQPNYADWEAIVFYGNHSVIEYATVEWSRNGVNPMGNQPDSVISHNIIRNIFWGAVSANTTTIQILENEISEAGHEGIDMKSGQQVVRNNTITDCHTGIMVGDSNAIVEGNTIRNCGDAITPATNPNFSEYLKKNTIEIAPDTAAKEWRYGNFAYHLFDNPTTD